MEDFYKAGREWSMYFFLKKENGQRIDFEYIKEAMGSVINGVMQVTWASL